MKLMRAQKTKTLFSLKSREVFSDEVTFDLKSEEEE